MKVVSGSLANTRSHWIIAWDANTEPLQVRLGEWYKEGEAQVKAPAGRESTCRAKGVRQSQR